MNLLLHLDLHTIKNLMIVVGIFLVDFTIGKITEDFDLIKSILGSIAFLLTIAKLIKEWDKKPKRSK